MRYKWIRLFAFCSFALFVLVALNTFVFVPFNYDTSYGKFYAEENNSLDVVFIGNSTVKYGISTMEAWNKYGVTSYSINSAPTHPEIIMIAINEIARLQSPKVVYIDLFGLTYQGEDQKEHFVKNYYESVPDETARNMLKEKYAFLNTENNDVGKSGIELFKNHNEFRNPDFYTAFLFHGKTQYKGFFPQFMVSERKNDATLDPEMILDLPADGINYLEKILETCKQYPNINFVFGMVPRFLTKGNLHEIYMLRTAKEKIEKESNYEYVEWPGKINEMGLDRKKDMADGTHLNANGAKKFTDYMIEYFDTHYGICGNTHSQSVIDDFNSAYANYVKSYE